MSFGVKLAGYRRRAGMTQATLAKLIAIHPEHLGAIERDEHSPPKPRTVSRIIEVLHLSSEESSELIIEAFYSSS